MQRAITFTLALLLPTILHARVIKWEGKPFSVSISTERLTRIEFRESLRSVFLSRSDIAVEKEDRSLYVRALAPEVEDTLFVVGESGTTYEINLSSSDNPDQAVVILSIPKSLQVQAELASKQGTCSGFHALHDAREIPGITFRRCVANGFASFVSCQVLLNVSIPRSRSIAARWLGLTRSFPLVLRKKSQDDFLRGITRRRSHSGSLGLPPLDLSRASISARS